MLVFYCLDLREKMSNEFEDAIKTYAPTKPRLRTPLPRLFNEMTMDLEQQDRQMRNSSHSPNINNRENSYSDSDCDSDDDSSCSQFQIPEPHNKNILKDESQVEKNLCQAEKSLSNKSTIEISTSIKIFLMAVVILILCMIIPNATTSNAVDYREMPSKDKALKYIKEEIRQLKNEFQNQEKKIWSEIYSGIIEVISNPMKPSIFVLFAERNDPMRCLAFSIAELGRMALGSQKSLILKPAQLHADTGEVIQTLRMAIPNRKSVIFWDLLSINDGALKALHNICDRENPLVKEAIYIITVIAEGYDKKKNQLDFIENQLKSNFTGRIDDDSIQPLITRITDGPIISVNSEPNMNCRFKNSINY